MNTKYKMFLTILSIIIMMTLIACGGDKDQSTIEAPTLEPTPEMDDGIILEGERHEDLYSAALSVISHDGNIQLSCNDGKVYEATANEFYRHSHPDHPAEGVFSDLQIPKGNICIGGGNLYRIWPEEQVEEVEESAQVVTPTPISTPTVEPTQVISTPIVTDPEPTLESTPEPTATRTPEEIAAANAAFRERVLEMDLIYGDDDCKGVNTQVLAATNFDDTEMYYGMASNYDIAYTSDSCIGVGYLAWPDSPGWGEYTYVWYEENGVWQVSELSTTIYWRPNGLQFAVELTEGNGVKILDLESGQQRELFVSNGTISASSVEDADVDQIVNIYRENNPNRQCAEWPTDLEMALEFSSEIVIYDNDNLKIDFWIDPLGDCSVGYTQVFIEGLSGSWASWTYMYDGDLTGPYLQRNDATLWHFTSYEDGILSLHTLYNEYELFTIP